jgi:hypothetical protein
MQSNVARQTSVFAYTAPGSEYPEYLSVNLNEGAVEITVRGPKQPASRPVQWVSSGASATMTLPRNEIEELHAALGRFLSGAVISGN